MKPSPPTLLVLTAYFALTLTGVHAAAGPLVWNDEFDQPVDSGPDSARWVHDLGAGGWGNAELQTYTATRQNAAIVADPAATDGRALAITARRDATGAYTSARLKTQGKFSTTYGRIEARIRSTSGQGLWPAFWMLGDTIATVGWPACGEIDVLEIVGARPSVAHAAVHGPGYSGRNALSDRFTLPSGATFDEAYHVFAVDWSPGKIVWSVDDAVYHTVTRNSLPADGRWVFDDAAFFLLLNLAVGGHWPGKPDASTVFPQSLTIDYVRVYAATKNG